MCAFSLSLQAQAPKSNAEAYADMLRAHAAKHHSFREVEGYDAEAAAAYFKVDTTLVRSLRLGEPSLRFRKLEDGRYERVLDAALDHLEGDSVVAEHAGFLRDTVAAAELGRIRKGADAALRGNDPRFFRHFVVPAMISTAGIAGIISLFYIRSR